MLNHLRNAIVLLLILALPTQGFAAAGMLACSPVHGRVVVAPEIDAQGVDAAESAQHDHGAHHHANQSAHKAHSPAPQAHVDEHASQIVEVVSIAISLDSQSSSKCSACASCCFGAALLPGSVVSGTPDLALMPVPSLSLAPVSFLTDGPIRPPRFFLA